MPGIKGREWQLKCSYTASTCDTQENHLLQKKQAVSAWIELGEGEAWVWFRTTLISSRNVDWKELSASTTHMLTALPAQPP